MENIAYTVYPEVQPTQEQWMEEFKVGRLVIRKCPNALNMMNLWKEEKGGQKQSLNFKSTIEKLKP